MERKRFLILAILIVVLCSCGKSTLYPETAKVVEICNDEVVVETCTGNLFAFYGAEDWMIGDCISLIMDSCGTSRVTDDIIIDAHYSAWKIN